MKQVLIIIYVLAATNSHSLTSFFFFLFFEVNKTEMQFVVFLRNLKAPRSVYFHMSENVKLHLYLWLFQSTGTGVSLQKC